MLLRSPAFLAEPAKVFEIAVQLADRFRRHPPSDATIFPLAELRALASAGLLGVALPTRLSGLGIGLEPGLRGALLPLLGEIGRGNLPLGRVYEGHVNALLLIDTFGSDPQLARAAEAVVQKHHVFGVWNTGPAGSPQLVPQPNGKYVLTGSKTFATGVRHVDAAIVTAALPDGGWQMCIVPVSESNLEIRPGTWNPLGMEASESSTVEFPSMEIAEDALLGQPGDYYAEPTFTGGALRFSAVQLGGARALFHSCCEFIRQHGRAEDLFQLRRLAEMAVLLESASQWLARASSWLEDGFAKPGELASRSQMMRVASEEICTRVIQLVEVSVGARGLATSEPFSRTIRDLQMYLRQAGFDQAFQAIGRHALEENA